MKNHFLYLCLFLLSSLTVLTAQADFSRDKCSHVLMGSGEIQINRQWDPNTGICIISLMPRNVMNSKYRSYYFNSQGHFMVFNVYGKGPDAQMTGARDFFTFPITEDYPDFSIEPNGDVVVKMVSGHLFRVSAKNFSIVSLTPGSFTEKPLAQNNKGGVEINLKSGYWIDGGFKIGSSSLSNPKLTSTVKSSKSPGTCNILNNDILNYEADGDYIFKYENQDLTRFLETKCPSLKF